MVSSFRIAVALALLLATDCTAWVAFPPPARGGAAACRLRSVPKAASAPRCAVMGGLRAVDGGQGGEREQSSMESWNEIMYSELRRRGAVNSNELAPPPQWDVRASFGSAAPRIGVSTISRVHA